MIRQAFEMAAMDNTLPWNDVEAVGGWWNRKFNPEVDLVGADRSPVAQKVSFVGSVKWLNTPVDRHDLAALRESAPQVPGFDQQTGLVVATRSGVDPRADVTDIDVVWGPANVIAAWQS